MKKSLCLGGIVFVAIAAVGVALIAVAVLGLTGGTAQAFPNVTPEGSPASCLVCHGSGGAVAEIFQAAHDGQVGECLSCHLYQGESIHGKWGATTASCARCHRTHSSPEAHLLVEEEDALCEFCHGATAGNAQTNVMGGILRYNSGSLRGGGFESAKMNTTTNVVTASDNWSFPVGSTASRPSTSEHNLGVANSPIWGSGSANMSPMAYKNTTSLKCVSCHDPHAFQQTYRMLKKIPTDSGASFVHGSTNFTFVTDQLQYAKKFPTSSILAYDTADYTETDYAAPDVYDADGNAIQVKYGTQSRGIKYSQQMNNWCASCHERYHAEKDGRGATGSDLPLGDAIFTYRHKTGDQMSSANTTTSCGYAGGGCHAANGTGTPPSYNLNKNLSCLGCHVSHGSAADMNTYGQVLRPDGTPNTGSILLRIDNRGVCQNAYCHPRGTSIYMQGFVQGSDY